MSLDMTSNRYANVFLRDGVAYVFPLAFVETWFTVDTCSGQLDPGFTAESLGLEIKKALHSFGRAMTPEEFKSRKNPLLTATRQRSQKELNVGLGHIEVDWLLETSGCFQVVPHRPLGSGSSPMLEQQITTSAACSAAELGAAAMAALKKSQAASEH